MPIGGRLVKGLGAGIGSAIEAYDGHKRRKSGQGDQPPASHTAISNQQQSLGKTQNSDEPPDYSDLSDVDDDEAVWALDDASRELDPPSYNALEGQPIDEAELARAFLQNHHLHSNLQPPRPLPRPVIIPQRRPTDATRGFVRAYAPLLGECAGIDQPVFLDFIDNLNQSTKGSKAFEVINVASIALMANPFIITHIVALATRRVSHAAEEMQTRHGRNTFLDRINEELFKPRGLYCMVLTFKPNQPTGRLRLNLITNTVESVVSQFETTSTPETGNHSFQSSSGRVQSEVTIRECAPLIYPAIDAAATHPDSLDAHKQSVVKNAGHDISDYLDRRRQAEYASTHANSAFVTPADKQGTFASRWSDPNHPTNSGTLLGLLTGGAFDPRAKRQGRAAQRRARLRGEQLTEEERRDIEMGRKNYRIRSGMTDGHQKKQLGLLGRVLTKDVLYLTVVNLPKEGEVA